MNNDNLVRMANQIGTFFESMPDPQEAARDLAGHIRLYWEPRMRLALLDLLDAEGGKDLSALVRAALQAHRTLLLPLT